MDTIEITSGDSFRVRVTVTDQATNAALPLGAATIEAAASRNGQSVAANIVNVDLAAGIYRYEFAPGALSQGSWLIQSRVSLNGETQTVSELRVTCTGSVF